MYLSHVHFQMVGPFENLATLTAGVRHKSALMLVPDMPQQSALEIEGATALSTAKFLRALGRLAQCVDIVLLCVVQPLESGHGGPLLVDRRR